MSRLRFLSAISLLLPVLPVAGCSDGPTCGPGGAPKAGLVASADALTLTYGNVTAARNNDCPAANAPAGVISLTLVSTQTDGDGLLTLCVARPDLLAKQSQTLGHDVAGAEVHLVDLNGSANGCTFEIDRSPPVTGTSTTAGMCSDGSDPAGFALTVDGGLTLTRTCGSTVDTVHVTLRGTVAVGTMIAF